MNRLFREILHLVRRRHLREIHFSYQGIQTSDRQSLREDFWRLLANDCPISGEDIDRLEERFASLVGARRAVAFGSGRRALSGILKALAIGPGDEVIVPAFTCVVVPYAVVHAGARPVYADIRDDYRLDLDDLAKKITSSTKAIIVQHPFGLPERMEKVMDLARDHGLKVIEDCAHVFGGSAYAGRYLGSWGNASFFSFEVTKPLPAGWGGIAVASDPALAEALTQAGRTQHATGRRQNLRVCLQLLFAAACYHPNFYFLGRWILALAYRIGLLPISIPSAERLGAPPEGGDDINDLQARLILKQLDRLPEIQAARREGTEYLDRQLMNQNYTHALLRYPFQVERREEAVEFFRRHQIELGQWFQAPLHPADCDMEKAGYRRGDCPNAERISRRTVNLPTLMNESERRRVLDVAQTFVKR